MQVEPAEIPEVLVVTPPVFGDERGFFTEAFNLAAFEQATGIRRVWVQDNHSRSGRGVLRGLHFQNPQPQGKLVRCAAGAIYDVVADIRRSSPTFGSWVGVELSGENFRQLWVPEGFAHGFLVLSETADVLYKATDYYLPEGDRAVRWDDPTLAIDWPIQGTPVISDKDDAAPLLNDADLFA
jgi:dTDP-4-dehydrorhamnose 3,5-epimerase